MVDPSFVQAPDAGLTSLRYRWWGVVALGAAGVAGGFAWLTVAGRSADAARWALAAALVLAAQLTLVWRNLRHNHRPGETATLPGLGAGNWATLLRGLALAMLAGFLLIPRPGGAGAWIPALLYTAAILVDLLDGYLARITDHVTTLGATLDMEYDGLGMLIVTALAGRSGQLPGWYVILGLARYLFVAGLWVQRRRGLPIHELTDSTVRRLAAGVQMGFMSVILWPVFTPPATTLAGVLFAVPFLAGFTRDWLVVSGAVAPRSGVYQQVQRLYRWVARWVPLPLRLAAILLAARFLTPVAAGASDLAFAYRALGAAGGALAVGVSLLAAGSGLLVGLGVATRLADLGLLAAACADLAVRGFVWPHAGLLICTITLLYLGPGAYALWRGDDALFSRRAGARPRR